MTTLKLTFEARPYQTEVVKAVESGIKNLYCVWHRKAGKDRIAAWIESILAYSKPGLYWHALPRYEDARKVIWDAITPEGDRLIDVCFPHVKRRSDHEMKIELHNGAIWQPVGADNFNSLVGAFPRHVTYSEFALMHPNARTYLRPAIAMAGGTEMLITTPRGYNHAFKLWQYAKASPEWFTSLKTVDDTKVLPEHVLCEEAATMPEELFRQEYYCDWSAANVGSILGRYMEAADKEGRITTGVYDPTLPLYISSDIGFRDTTAWWEWQVRPDGFACIGYTQDSGMDADDWIDSGRLRGGYEAMWLPHDAKAKTFATKRSALERFMASGLAKRVELVPRLSVADRINAARIVMRSTVFERDACETGIDALREWQYKFNEETRVFTKNPDDNWAIHGGDAFSYGAQMVRAMKSPRAEPVIEVRGPITIGEFIERGTARETGRRRARI